MKQTYPDPRDESGGLSKKVTLSDKTSLAFLTHLQGQKTSGRLWPLLRALDQDFGKILAKERKITRGSCDVERFVLDIHETVLALPAYKFRQQAEGSGTVDFDANGTSYHCAVNAENGDLVDFPSFGQRL